MNNTAIKNLTAPEISLYYEAEALIKWHPSEGVVDGKSRICGSHIKDLEVGRILQIIPYLRPLSDIKEADAKIIALAYEPDLTDEKLKEWGYMEYEWQDNPYTRYINRDNEFYCEQLNLQIGSPDVWKVLLHLEFDLFGWIDEGKALTKI